MTETNDQEELLNKRTGQINQALERAILEKLYQEWRISVLNLGRRNPSFAPRMERPRIIISDMEQTLGLWDPLLREIRMARHLVRDGRWDSVVEVLHHEMAHQLASTLPGYPNETAHGPLFVECCRMFGANPRASGGYRTLEQRIWGVEGGEDDRIMIKVKKLMALAASKNPHEAALAAAKAGELIARYNIDAIRSNEQRDFESIIITDAVLKRTQPEIIGATILDHHYFVQPVWIPVYVPGKEKMGTALEISGTPSNLKIADYVFAFVLGYAQKSWLDYKAKNPSCRSRSGYMTGVVHGFSQTLDRRREALTRQESPLPGNAPAVVKDLQLDAYVGGRYPGLRTVGVSHGSRSRDAYSSGLSKGRDLVLSKAVTTKGVNSGRCIGP
ncbi:hypothetical protein HRM2_37710 [Desulforapulum autotrophicum HRM2]|uniref:Uncharacterized protein n=1 Tax=Desulforapulum autotrophicum (strain ATCC 43914 / DSM 3382 / VKM B-1955 / HRM2) TaxID=177437 RepID=C0QAP6_DESAH|nr:hypothetical protein HRM2_37710 [Desulforapulum autotrophicum HRM2]